MKTDSVELKMVHLSSYESKDEKLTTSDYLAGVLRIYYTNIKKHAQQPKQPSLFKTVE